MNYLDREVQRQAVIVKEQLFPLSHSALLWKPDAETWNICECLEHLNLFARYYSLQLRLRTSDLPPENGAQHERFSSGWFGSWILKALSPERDQKMKTLSRYNPKFGNADENPIQEFLLHLRELQIVIDRARNLNLNRHRVPVQFFPILTLNLGDALQFMLLHQQRHLNQALELVPGNEIPLLARN